MIMRLNEIDTLQFLENKGFRLSKAQYYRYKRRIKESRFDRLSLIAKEGFIDQHLERLDQLELVNQELWQLYKEEKNTFKKSQILMQIAEVQQYISSYYEASQYVLEKQVTTDKKRKKKGQQQKEESEQIGVE